MCYYATTDYVCGDWKWGNMKERCPRQHRMGETCGAKLVHHESVTKSDQECKICQEMQIKVRRLRKEQDNIARWRKEGTKFLASIEKAERESCALREQPSYPANGYPAPVQVYGQPDRHTDRHSISAGNVSGGTTSSSNRHASSATGQLPPTSSNRHGVPYVSSRR
jgi:hypothetical protein